MQKVLRVRQLIQNLTLAAATTVVTVGGLEAISRLTEKPAQATDPAPARGSVWNWEDDNVRSYWDESIPDGVGWPPTAETNGDGMRDRPRPPNKLPGLRRIAVLGDSVTYGYGLPIHQAFPQQMEALAWETGRPTEVFNVALPGWSTRQEREAYQRIVRPYKPDLVVVAVCLNDIPDLHFNLTRPPQWLTWLHDHSALIRRLVDAQAREIRNVKTLFATPPDDRTATAMALFEAEIAAFHKDVIGDGSDFLVVLFPFRFQVLPAAPKPTVQSRLATFCTRNGIRYLDALPIIAPLGAEAYLDYDHFSARGAHIIAATLLDVATHGLSNDDFSKRRTRTVDDRLRDPDALVRLDATRTIDPTRVDHLLALRLFDLTLADPAPHVRWAAASALRNVDDPAHVPFLARCADSEDSYVRAFGTWRLGRMKTALTPEAVAVLRRHATDRNALDRDGAIVALARRGVGEEFVPSLIREIDDEDAGQRRWKAIRAIALLGPAAATTARASLIKATHSADTNVRLEAVRSLAVGRECASLPVLRDLTHDPISRIARAATEAVSPLERQCP